MLFGTTEPETDSRKASQRKVDAGLQIVEKYDREIPKGQDDDAPREAY
jgi:hypothetical protein